MSNFVPEQCFCKEFFFFLGCVKNGIRDFKVVILALKTKNIIGDQKSLKMTFTSPLPDEDCGQTQKDHLEIWESLKQPFIKTAGCIQNQGYLVPYELKRTDFERSFCISEMLLERYKKSRFCIGLSMVMKNECITITLSN